jgi:hypothetical protein
MERNVVVLQLENEVEAGLLGLLLDAEQIPYLIRSYHDLAYDGLFQTQQGWGHLESYPQFAERIKEIYASLNH